MAFKLALSAGHYKYTSGKRCLKSLDPNETREWVLNDRIADKIEAALSAYDGIAILRLDDTTGETNVSLSERSTAANNFDADFYLAVHHNAGVNGGTGGGIIAFVYTYASAKSMEWQKDLYDALIAKTGLVGNRSTPLAKADLYECREPSMPAVLLELGFMDSQTDVPIILTEKFATQCAEACVEVIVKKANLNKKPDQSVGNSYKLITSVNRYASAADAAAKTNSKGTYEAGTYYIYNKYPDGLNGMFNISKDSTGASAGSWINPAENVVLDDTPMVTKLYRVRKTKDDAKTQKGAYSNLDGAIACCQDAGEGYHVFDWNYNIVYSYKAESTAKSEEVTKEEPVVAVYNLDYPEKNKIVEHKSVEESDRKRSCVKAINGILANNSNFDIEIAKTFFAMAPKYGIDPMMAIAQSVLETGWFKYNGSAVKAEQHNYCGLGVTSNGVTGGAFDTIENGVRAQLQHLYAYGCKYEMPDGEDTIVDPRFKYVTRGIAPYWQNLAGRWAVPGYDKKTYATPKDAMIAGMTYGQKIRALCVKLEATDVTDADIEKYFPVEKPVEPTTPVEPVTPVVPETPIVPDISNKELSDNVNYVFRMIRKLFEAIINFFKKFKA